MADVLGLIYDVSKDFIKFAAGFVETPDIIKIMTREIQILEKQLNAPSSEGLTKDDDLDALSRDLEVFVKSLRLPDGKSRRRKWTHQAVQAVQSKSLHDRLTSLNRRYQAQVNARLVKSQCDAQESLVSQKEALDAIAAVAIHVDEQINAIRAEKLKALGAEVLHWLSPPANESDKHALLIEKHHAGTGAWLYETDEFKAWESRSDDGSAAASPPGKQIQTLWLHGKRRCLLGFWCLIKANILSSWSR
jgi:recombinational DNA repair ATPase RecF